MPDAPREQDSASPPARLTPGRLFAALVLIEALFLLWLLGSHRMMRGHDGLQYFTLQYWFLNGVATTGEAPQWMPHMTQGTVSNWWYALQASLSQNALLLAGTLLKGANFTGFFYAGMFLDEMLLLVGMWLWSGRFLSSAPARFFACAAAIGSCIWMDQPWWNFHFYYALPLLLHLGHAFLETGRWRHALLAANLLALQTLGSLPYMIPVTTLAIAIYFSAWIFFVDRGLLLEWRPLKQARGALPCMVLAALGFAMVWVVLKHGTAEIVTYNYGRGQDERTSLVGFLSYGGRMNPGMWLEAAVSLSPSLDQTVYLGIFSLFFAALTATCWRDRKVWVVWSVVAALLIFSSAGFFAYGCYRVWPVMSYYRHIAMACLLVKPFLCLLAGIGFERFVMSDSPRRWPLVVGSAAMAALSLWLWHLSNTPGSWDELLRMIRPSEDLSLRQSMDPALIILRLMSVSVGAAAVAILGVFLALRGPGRIPAAIVGVVLTAHLLDLYGYKCSQAAAKTFPMDAAEWNANRFQNIPWTPRRQPSAARSPRAEIFHKDLFARQYGVCNWAMGEYLFSEPVGSVHRVDHWLLPLDDLMRSCWGQPQRAFHLHPDGLQALRRLDFPTNHIAALKFSALAEDKLQVFRDAVIPVDTAQAGRWFTDPSFRGDMLFLHAPDPADARNGMPSTPALSTNDRMPARGAVSRFDANHLDLVVEAGTDGTYTGPLWLFYSDVWHPHWSATVDGNPVEVRRANLAYKAVPLHAGRNEVRFRFGSRLFEAVTLALAVNSLAWIVIVAVTMLRIIRGGEPFSSARPVSEPPRLWPSGPRPGFLIFASLAVLALGMAPLLSSRLRNDLLLVSAGKGHERLVRILAALRADVNVRDSEGASPLFFAASQGRAGAVRELLRLGADPDAVCRDGSTPLLKAAVENETESAAHLIAAGARVDTFSSEGSTPLLYAAWNNNPRLLRLLLERRANADIANRGGRTPLMCAAWQGDAGAVRLLLEHGADPNRVDENGWTALKCAHLRQFKEVARMLSAAGAREEPPAKTEGPPPPPPRKGRVSTR